jgi:hypothetical protein
MRIAVLALVKRTTHDAAVLWSNIDTPGFDLKTTAT